MSGHQEISSARASPRLRTSGSSVPPISSATDFASGLDGCGTVEATPRGLCQAPRREPHWRDARQASEVGRRRKAEFRRCRTPIRRTPPTLLAWYERHARVLPWRIGPAERRARRPARSLPRLAVGDHAAADDGEGGRALFPALRRALADASTRSRRGRATTTSWPPGRGSATTRARATSSPAPAPSPRGRARAFPRTAAELARLPGIGAYTSAAIAAIAFDEPVAVVDGNVERVVARALRHRHAAAGRQGRHPRQSCSRSSRATAPGEFAEALMDLGATICTPQKARLRALPVGPSRASRGARGGRRNCR